MLGHFPSYDEEGNPHNHDPNTTNQCYLCSNGHSWSQTTGSSCPHCDWNIPNGEQIFTNCDQPKKASSDATPLAVEEHDCGGPCSHVHQHISISTVEDHGKMVCLGSCMPCLIRGAIKVLVGRPDKHSAATLWAAYSGITTRSEGAAEKEEE